MMARLIVRRLAAGVVIVWLVSVLVFLATQLLPGDAANELLGRQATPEAIAALQKQLHLNDPLFAQYWHWLRDLVTGHWGNSLVSQDSVVHIVGTGIENTGLVMLLTMVVATPIAIWLGVVSALHTEGWLDHALSVVTLVLVALPAFVIAVALVFLFATNVSHVLPAASLVNPDESIFSQLNLVVLPTATLALAVIPYPLRMVRQAMVEVLDSEYVSLARLHGLSRRRVIFRHALPNAVATTIQASALNLVFLAGGVVVVETVFSYPGLGRALEQAVSERDIPVVQTIVVLLAVFYVIVNLVADVLVVLVTPRSRVSGATPPETVANAMTVAVEPLA